MSVESTILYSFRRCPYAMRARMALAVSGMVVELREVVLREKPSEMLEISPKGTVPVLLLASGAVIEQSLDIMLWTLDKSDPHGWLEPETGSYPAMLDLVARSDSDFKHNLDRYKYANRYEGADALEHRKAAEAFLAELENRLEVAGFLFGSRPSLADYAIMPFIRQFANVDRMWFDGAPYLQVQRWLQGLLVSDIFQNVMQKYPQWHPGQEPVSFPA